jgi:hypothetical protein
MAIPNKGIPISRMVLSFSFTDGEYVLAGLDMPGAWVRNSSASVPLAGFVSLKFAFSCDVLQTPK